MNYTFEGNINFTEELLKMVCDDTEKVEEVCLISGESLKDRQIKLGCGHKFNYECILNEIKSQRKKNRLETQKTSLNEIKCPYCRKNNKGILPWYTGYDKIKNINWSATNKKIIKRCKIKIKSGKRKGEVCGCPAKYDTFCGRHKNQNTHVVI